MHLNLFLELLKEQILRQAEIKYNTKGYINPIEKLIIESLMKGICVFLYTPQKILIIYQYIKKNIKMNIK